MANWIDELAGLAAAFTQIFFYQNAQTPQETLRKKVSALQFGATFWHFLPPTKSSQVGGHLA